MPNLKKENHLSRKCNWSGLNQLHETFSLWMLRLWSSTVPSMAGAVVEEDVNFANYGKLTKSFS